MADNFKVEKAYENRTYECRRFSLTIHDKEFKGEFRENKIQWLHPHPEQELDVSHLKALENEIYQLLGEDGEESEETDDIKIKPYAEDKAFEVYQFELTIGDEAYKGLIRDEEVNWFYPNPQLKVDDKEVEKIEKRLQKAVKKQ